MNYLHEIKDYECVGDALGKINYNFLEIDAKSCNIASLYYEGKNNFLEVLSNLNNNLNDLDALKRDMYSPSIFNQAYTATNLLSSYWGKHEFSVYYKQDKSFFCQSIPETINSENLKFLARSFLTVNYPSNDYKNGTIARVVIPIYNTPPKPASSTEIKNYTNTLRDQTINFTKDDTYVSYHTIIKFQKLNNNWEFVKIEF